MSEDNSVGEWVLIVWGQESFVRAKQWVSELQRQGNPNIVICLCGNKSDLAAKRAVDTSEAENYAAEARIMFIETSAKTATNVNDMFVDIARKLPKTSSSQRAPTGGISIQSTDPAASGTKKGKGGGCC